MLKGGPLLPYDFRVVEFSKEEKKAWDWYTRHRLIVSTVMFEGNLYGFNRLGQYRTITPIGIESECDRGTWIDDDSALYMNKEALRFYV